MPRQLTKEQDYLVQFIVVTKQPFATVARKAKLKGKDELVFPDHKSEEYRYARKSRAKTYLDSLNSYQSGSAKSQWRPIARKDSDPRDVFQSTDGIHELTEEEFLAQSTFGSGIEEDSNKDITPVAKKKETMSRTPPRDRNRGRSATPNRPVKK